MATVTQYASYIVFFHDEEEYLFALAVAGGDPSTGGLLDMAPNTAAALFGIPVPYPSGNMDAIDKGIYFNTQWSTDGTTSVDVGWTIVPPQHVYLFPNDDDGVLVPGVSGSYGGTGRDTIVKWSGSIVYMKGAAPTTATPTAIPQRRWIGGLELEPLMEGGFSFAAGTATGCRDASRTFDGLGFAVRGQNNSTTYWTRRLNEYSAGIVNRKSWERLYVRIRRVGTGPVAFWRCHCTAASAAGATLVLNTSGQIDMYSVSSIGVGTLRQSTSGWSLNKWYKLDMFLEYPSSGANPGYLTLLRNGSLVATLTDTAGSGGMATAGNHQESDIGLSVAMGSGYGNTDAQVEIDLDDWICSDWPVDAGSNLILDSMDFLMGSHVRRLYSIGGSVTGYTPAGAYKILNQGHNPQQQLNSGLTSTTSGAVASGNTDVPLLGVQDNLNGLAVGPVAAVVGINTTNVGSTDGQLGYSVAGGANVMTTIDETSAAKFNSVLYRPSGLIEPAEISPFLVRYTKSADANSAVIQGMQAAVEYIGIWGQEDVMDPDLFPEDLPRNNNVHNCWYPSFYGSVGPDPQMMVFACGGTYTGNGTQQDINLPDACHMLFIRSVGASASGVKWFGAGLGGHLGTTERVVPNFPVRVWWDAVASTFKFTVTGTNGDVNQIASTYQWIAFCDPGMRYCCCGAYNTPTGVTSRVNSLQNDDFLPEFAFIQKEVLGNTSNTEGLFCKGPGNTGTIGNQLNNAAQLATFGSFALGSITTGANVHLATGSQMNYAAFRDTEPNCGWNMLQILSYTGDGTASRVITLTPTSGRYPLFALVCPTSGSQAAIFRDPTHTANNSYTFTSLSNTTTGITAGGVDSITVGISLNANGIIYNVFVICGDTAGWNNGTFYPPNCDEPAPWYNPPMDPPDVAVMGNGGLVLNGSVALTILKDVTGIYTLQSGKRNDTMYDRQTGQPSVDVKIPDPFFKTGYIGG